MKKGGDTKNDFPDFLTHLEYLGYEVQYTGEEEDESGIGALHEHRPGLWVFKRHIGIGVTITYGMGQNAVTYLSDYLRLLNRLNKESIISTFYTNADEEKPNVHICAMYAATYERRSFGTFMDMLHRDHDNLRKISEFDFYTEDGIIEVVPKTQVS